MQTFVDEDAEESEGVEMAAARAAIAATAGGEAEGDLTELEKYSEEVKEVRYNRNCISPCASGCARAAAADALSVRPFAFASLHSHHVLFSSQQQPTDELNASIHSFFLP